MEDLQLHFDALQRRCCSAEQEVAAQRELIEVNQDCSTVTSERNVLQKESCLWVEGLGGARCIELKSLVCVRNSYWASQRIPLSYEIVRIC